MKELTEHQREVMAGTRIRLRGIIAELEGEIGATRAYPVTVHLLQALSELVTLKGGGR